MKGCLTSATGHESHLGLILLPKTMIRSARLALPTFAQSKQRKSGGGCVQNSKAHTQANACMTRRLR